MSEPTTAGMSRRQLLEAAGAAAAAAVAAGSLASPAAAATPQPMPFKASVAMPLPQVTVFMIPLSPPLLAHTLASTGSADPLGPITYTSHHIAHLGADGIAKSATDGIGVFTAANGDALFSTWSGLWHPTATGSTLDGAFIVTGGKGKYCGAAGSGSLGVVVDRVANQVTFSWDGTITLP